MPSPTSLIAECHGEALRMLCDHAKVHYSGLTVAARIVNRSGAIDARLRRKLEVLDNAYAVVRHITQVSCSTLLEEVSTRLEEDARESEDRAQRLRPVVRESAQDGTHELEVPSPECPVPGDAKAPVRTRSPRRVAPRSRDLHAPDVQPCVPQRHVHFYDTNIMHAIAVDACVPQGTGQLLGTEDATIEYYIEKETSKRYNGTLEDHIEKATKKFYSSSAPKNSVQKMLGQLDQACNKLAQIAAGHQGSTAEVARAKEILAIMDALLAKARGTKDLKLQLETMDEIQKKLGECEDF